jgi:hypothetical protein
MSVGRTFGGKSMSAWRWSTSPEHSSNRPSHASQRVPSMAEALSSIAPVSTFLRYLVTRTKWYTSR